MREIPPTAGMPLLLQDIVAGFVGSGKMSFEQLLADYLGFPEVDLYSSGTLCLSLAFEAIKEMSGRSRVIVPAYTCPLVPIAARAAGVEVVLCDTRAGSFEMDPVMLEKLCDRSVAAVVPTDIAGLPVDISQVKAIASASGALIVEDAAQALGARINGQSAGSAADVAVYSLAVGKGLSLYDGGIIAVRDSELRKKIRTIAARRVSQQPQTNFLRIMQMLGMWLLYNPEGMSIVYGRELRHCLDKGDLVRAVGEHFELEIPAYDFDEFRKHVGASALLRLPEFVRSNRRRALSRCEILARQVPAVSIMGATFSADSQPFDETRVGTWPFLMIRAESSTQRDLIMQKLWRSGLGVTRLFIHALNSYDYLRGLVPATSMPNAEAFAAETFSISNSHFLTDREFDTIVSTIQSVVGEACQVVPEKISGGYPR